MRGSMGDGVLWCRAVQCCAVLCCNLRRKRRIGRLLHNIQIEMDLAVHEVSREWELEEEMLQFEEKQQQLREQQQLEEAQVQEAQGVTSA